MKVVKIYHKAMRANDDGDWLVWAMCAINGHYRYCKLLLDTFEGSKAIQEGQSLTLDKDRIIVSLKGTK